MKIFNTIKLNGSRSAALLLMLATSMLCAILWTISSQSRPEVQSWKTYSSSDLPFVFDYPLGWSVKEVEKKEYSAILMITDTSSNKIFSITYKKQIPGGITDGASVCNGNNSNCLYIYNQTTGNFSRTKESSIWTGTIKSSRDHIFIEIIKDKLTDGDLTILIQSIRLKPQQPIQ